MKDDTKGIHGAIKQMENDETQSLDTLNHCDWQHLVSKCIHK